MSSRKNPLRFKKEVLRQGVYQHPVDKWAEELDVSTEAKLAEIAEASNAALAAGTKVWLPDGHTFTAKDNTGWVERFVIEPCPKDENLLSIFAIGEVTDPDYIPKVGKTIKDVSVLLDDYGNEHGESWGTRIVHVALCPNPVFTDQANFVALSTGKGNVAPVFRFLDASETDMKPTRIAPPPTSEETVRSLALSSKGRKALAALGVETDAREMDQDLLAEVLDAIANRPAAPAVDVKKALSLTGSPEWKELHTTRTEMNTAKVDAMVKEGRIPASVKDDVLRLLSVRHAFALAATGAAEEVSVAETLAKVLAAIPEGAVLSLDEKIARKNLAVAGGRAPDAPGTFDGPAEVTRRLAMHNPAKK